MGNVTISLLRCCVTVTFISRRRRRRSEGMERERMGRLVTGPWDVWYPM